MQIIENMPAHEYHAAEGINASSIKQGRLSMRHMHQAMTTYSEPTKAMSWGTLVHMAVLEPDRFESELAIYDGIKTGKGAAAWKQFKIDHAQDFIVSRGDFDNAKIARDNVFAHGYAAELLDGARTELSLFWETDEYGKAKARLDFLQGEIVGDIKNTVDINPQKLGYTCGKLGYHISGGWYSEGSMQTDVTFMPDFVIIWIESKAPYDVYVSRMSSESRDMGFIEAKGIAERYHQCEKSGKYPGLLSDKRTYVTVPETYLIDVVEE